MADKRIRRRFTPEFKAQAVKRVLGGRSVSEVATELGLSTGQLSTWRTEHLAAGSAEALARPTRGPPSISQPDRLRRWPSARPRRRRCSGSDAKTNASRRKTRS